MKMEIKIRCQCGSDLCFEDTPVNGQLRYPFACPTCGADCTVQANAYIQQQQPSAMEPPAAMPEFRSPQTSWLKPINSRNEDPMPAAIILRPPPPPKNFHAHVGESILSGVNQKEEVTATGDEASLARVGLAGLAALGVGILGAIGWLYVAKATGFEIGYLAWALGGLIGWTSRLMAPRGHALLGGVATFAAVLAIGGGQYLVSRWQIQSMVESYVPEAYGEILAYAKETTTAQNSEDLGERTAEFKLVRAFAGSESDPIAAYQAYQIADSGFALLGLVGKDHPTVTFAQRDELTDAAAVTIPEIAKFDAEVVPALQKLVAGQPSQQEYQASLEARLHDRISASTVAAFAVNRYTILWIFLGVGTAYRLARNPGLQY